MSEENDLRRERAEYTRVKIMDFMGDDGPVIDRARGYDAGNQLYVEPVCSKCHHKREDARSAQTKS